MPTINGRVCVVNGTPVDKVFSDGRQVYGRNLLAGVNRTIHQAPGSFQWVGNVPRKVIKVGEPLCFSLFINNAPHAVELVKGNTFAVMRAIDVSDNKLLEAIGNSINFDADGISQASFVVPNATTNIQIFLITYSMLKNPYYGYSKVEYGTTPTHWTPAPEDILK